MDNLQQVILNASTDGKAWKEHQVRLSQFMGRQEDTPKGSETLWRYEWEKLVKPFLENGTIRGDEEFCSMDKETKSRTPIASYL